jgi:hypothetical protein
MAAPMGLPWIVVVQPMDRPSPNASVASVPTHEAKVV